MFLPLCMLGLPQMQQGCDPSYPNAIESSKSHVGFVWLKVFRNLGRFVKLVIRTSEKVLHVFGKVMFFEKGDAYSSGNAIHSSKWGPNSQKKWCTFFSLAPDCPPKSDARFFIGVPHRGAMQKQSGHVNQLTGDACQKKCLAILRFITGYRSRMFNKWLPKT